MRVRAIDINNDWTFGKGRNDYRYGRDAVAQLIKTRLQSFLGDCFFAESAGIDWFNLLGSKRILDLRLAIKAVILNTQDVTGVAEVSFNVDEQRNLTITCEATTVYGDVSVSASPTMEM